MSFLCFICVFLNLLTSHIVGITMLPLLGKTVKKCFLFMFSVLWGSFTILSLGCSSSNIKILKLFFSFECRSHYIPLIIPSPFSLSSFPTVLFEMRWLEPYSIFKVMWVKDLYDSIIMFSSAVFSVLFLIFPNIPFPFLTAAEKLGDIFRKLFPNSLCKNWFCCVYKFLEVQVWDISYLVVKARLNYKTVFCYKHDNCW